MAWIDCHAHLYDCTNDQLRLVCDEAAVVGVDTVVNTATSLNTARKVIDQCGRYPNILKPAVGISPFDSIDVEDGWDAQLVSLINGNPAVIAVGEIGLDCTNPAYPHINAQMPVFIRQLEISIDLGLTAVIHSRGMEKKVAEICRDIGVSKAIFHCFTGDAESMEHIVDCGYYISISGIITYKNSHLRDMIRHMPASRLLIETDAPYLSPTPHRGKPNRPSYLIRTAEEIAALLQIGEAQLAEILRANFGAAMSNAPTLSVADVIPSGEKTT